MFLFIVLGVVVLMTLGVLGALFYMLAQEGKTKIEEKVVPLTDLAQLKKELSNQLFEPNQDKVIEKDNEVIPVYESKIQVPVQEEPPQASPEDIAYKKRAQLLEDELLAISKKADGQSEEARQLIINLTRENESLKSEKALLEETQQKLTQLESQADGLKAENGSLQSQLETTNAKVVLLEEQMTSVKMQMGEEIARANETVTELTREKEALLSTPKPVEDETLSQELAALKIEKAQLNQRCDDIEKDLQGLKGNNQELIAKCETLEYELIKAKAQSSGLERIGFNYKNQLEDFFQKMNAAQVTNDHLAQVKNRLEGMVDEIKSQNEELSKKDQLAQFELQQNRARLQELERECQEAKTRLQQQAEQ